jgi:hypothetical protein
MVIPKSVIFNNLYSLLFSDDLTYRYLETNEHTDPYIQQYKTQSSSTSIASTGWSKTRNAVYLHLTKLQKCDFVPHIRKKYLTYESLTLGQTSPITWTTILYCNILNYTIIHYTLLYDTILYYNIPCCAVLYYAMLHYTILHYIYYTMLR